MAILQTPLDLYRLLPKSNCGRCYLPTCLAFAAAVIKGDRPLGDCPHLAGSVIAEFAGKIDRPTPTMQGREEQLKVLKGRLAAVDFFSFASRLGAEVVSDRLVIKCLGKNFLIDASGNITSECHTHAGLAIPLLRYILHSGGDEPSGRWVAFRELNNAAAMSPLFQKRGESRLHDLADTHPDLFADLIDLFGGRPWEENSFAADIAIILSPLPKIPMLICYWHAEEDLTSKLALFFDATADTHLATSSIFELAVGLVMMFEKIARKHV